MANISVTIQMAPDSKVTLNHTDINGFFVHGTSALNLVKEPFRLHKWSTTATFNVDSRELCAVEIPEQGLVAAKKTSAVSGVYTIQLSLDWVSNKGLTKNALIHHFYNYLDYIDITDGNKCLTFNQTKGFVEYSSNATSNEVITLSDLDKETKAVPFYFYIQNQYSTSKKIKFKIGYYDNGIDTDIVLIHNNETLSPNEIREFFLWIPSSASNVTNTPAEQGREYPNPTIRFVLEDWYNNTTYFSFTRASSNITTGTFDKQGIELEYNLHSCDGGCITLTQGTPNLSKIEDWSGAEKSPDYLDKPRTGIPSCLTINNLSSQYEIIPTVLVNGVQEWETTGSSGDITYIDVNDSFNDYRTTETTYTIRTDIWYKLNTAQDFKKWTGLKNSNLILVINGKEYEEPSMLPILGQIGDLNEAVFNIDIRFKTIVGPPIGPIEPITSYTIRLNYDETIYRDYYLDIQASNGIITSYKFSPNLFFTEKEYNSLWIGGSTLSFKAHSLTGGSATPFPSSITRTQFDRDKQVTLNFPI